MFRDVVDVNLVAMAPMHSTCNSHHEGASGRIIDNGSLSANGPRPMRAADTLTKHAATG